MVRPTKKYQHIETPKAKTIKLSVVGRNH